ncbi:MAG: zf-HC2 domain-containing protein [Clostridia bacterium]|nr:zf-HC2 domain-containing protein [Clostridia bacterium]
MSKSCNEVRQNLSLYIDGQLSLKEMEKTRQHLADCQACQDEYTFLSGVVKIAETMPTVSAGEDFHQALRDKLVSAAAEKEAVNVPKKRPMWQALSGMAAAAAVIVLSVVAFGQLPKMGSLTEQGTLSSEPTPRMTQTAPEKEQKVDNINHGNDVVTPKMVQKPVYDAASSIDKEDVIEPASENAEVQSVGLSLEDVPADKRKALTTIRYTLTESAYSQAVIVLAGYEQRDMVYFIPQNEVQSICESIEALSGYVERRDEPASEQVTSDFVQIMITVIE